MMRKNEKETQEERRRKQEEREEKERRDKDNTEKLITAIPYYEIKRSIIFVSETDDSAFAFHKITGKQRSQMHKYPFSSKLQDNTSVIDPTTMFLKPQVEMSFVTMHYVMNLVEQAKFIFVFNSADTSSMPFKTIKNTLIKFVSMFRTLSKEELKELIGSCGVIITDARPDFQVSTYCERLQNMRQPGFLQKKYDNVIELVSTMLSEQRIMLLYTNKKAQQYAKDFELLTNKLSFFQMEGRVQFNLTSNYKNFIDLKLHKSWSTVFAMLYSNIDAITMGKGNEIQQSIYLLIKNYDKQRNSQPLKIQQKQNKSIKSLQMLRSLDTMAQIILEFSGYQMEHQANLKKNKQLLVKFLQFLYNQRMLRNEFIREFLMSYFVIYRILSNKDRRGDIELDLFHPAHFCDQVSDVGKTTPKMRTISLELLNQLEKDIQTDRNYPFQESLNLINGLLKYKDQPLLSFFTDRIYKKILKERAIVAYHLIQKTGKNKKMFLRNSVNFIRWATESSLIKDSLKIEVLINIGLELAEHQGLLQLALDIFNRLPEYEVCKHVRYIYQKKLSLNVQVLQYLPKDKRKMILDQYFEGYYEFLLKIGFEETVRELCMECLRLADGEEQRNYFKNKLIRARGNTLRDLHKSFLEKSVIQEKDLVVPSDFIDIIEEQMVYNNLIQP